MILLTGEEMARADKKAIDMGMPELILMETAGRSTAAGTYSRWQDRAEEGIVVISGGGNNGGDGLVAARYFDSWGLDVKVILLTSPENLEGVNRENYRMCRLQNIEIIPENSGKIDAAEDMIAEAGIIVDAMLGTGLKGAVRGKAAEMVELVNKAGAARIAVDIPTGVEAGTGRAPGGAVKADLTVTMQDAKVGHLLYPGRSFCGELTVSDLGFPDEVYDEIEPQHFRLVDEEVSSLLPPRPETGHKGTFGEVLVAAGSRNMPGAALLTAKAALAGGAGVVRLALPEESAAAITSAAPEIVLIPLAGEEGELSSSNLEKLIGYADSADAMALGPGLGSGEPAAELVNGLLKELDLPLVLDADGINNLSELALAAGYSGELIMTPHPGEMGRLLEMSPQQVVENKLDVAREFSREQDCELILKGADTLSALTEGEVFINPTGNQGMATAGSGDVLTGLTAGLLAQTQNSEISACLAPYLHGRAGDMALEEKGSYSLTAGDILDRLGAAFSSVSKNAVRQEDKRE
ncbi:NAD(P)H-hydrate dehydratase [Halarsenatibacter silvermanii]|uniref:Bifunctional NAD(P)H-hydrate repair enzyme n=1 Tax=Halarsenatibacter silvermanii TaxID=321763 RepID=A0A1G9NE05_9FIRM|nr:NAD(P)H-hydrate dehydratase [Halarsenatibacter silvermanii]SDL84643.1 NAD(P)H-hydrate epimerase [Halarsenatibacter silvermanii]